VMLVAAAFVTVPRNRFVNTFTSRFRGNADLPADGAEASAHAADGVERCRHGWTWAVPCGQSAAPNSAEDGG
jgi:hypothetical protein